MALGTGKFEVVYDGASRPMIQTPNGRLLSVSQFHNGKWQSYEREDSDCQVIVSALNWILREGPALINGELMELL